MAGSGTPAAGRRRGGACREQRGSAVAAGRVVPPVALDRAQGPGAFADRTEFEQLRIVPGVGRPGGGARRACPDQQVSERRGDLAQLGAELAT